MKKIREILLQQIIPALKKAKPGDLILGRKDHSQRIARAYPLPDYVSRFATRHVLPEFCFCLAGKCVVHLDGSCYLLKSGQAFFVGRNKYHFESFFDPRQSYDTAWFSFYSLNDFFVIHCRYDNQEYQTLQGMHVDTQPELVQRLDKILEKDLSSRQIVQEAHRMGASIEGYVRQTAAGEDYVFTEKTQRNYQRRLIKIAEKYIKENFFQGLSAAGVARVIGLSPKYFERLFHEISGNTFLRFLTMMRLEQASRLLNSTTLNISEIAGQCGFNDYSNFSRVFAKRFGVSPRQFRDRYAP